MFIYVIYKYINYKIIFYICVLYIFLHQILFFLYTYFIFQNRDFDIHDGSVKCKSANMELLLYITKRECDRYSSLNMCVAALYKIYILMRSI